MADLGSDFYQWLQDESPLVHGGVGNLQARLIDYSVTKQQHVDIYFARTLVAQAETSHHRLDPQCQLEQFSRRLIRFYHRYAVEKPGLVGDFHGLGFVEGGNCDQPDGGIQLCERRAEIGGTISEV